VPDLLETRYSPACVTVPNFVAVGQKVGLQVGEPHFFFGGGALGSPLGTSSCRTCVTIPNFGCR